MAESPAHPCVRASMGRPAEDPSQVAVRRSCAARRDSGVPVAAADAVPAAWALRSCVAAASGFASTQPRSGAEAFSRPADVHRCRFLFRLAAVAAVVSADWGLASRVARNVGSTTLSVAVSPQALRRANDSTPCILVAWVIGDFQGPLPQMGQICRRRSSRASSRVTPQSSGDSVVVMGLRAGCAEALLRRDRMVGRRLRRRRLVGVGAGGDRVVEYERRAAASEGERSEERRGSDDDVLPHTCMMPESGANRSDPAGLCLWTHETPHLRRGGALCGFPTKYAHRRRAGGWRRIVLL